MFTKILFLYVLSVIIQIHVKLNYVLYIPVEYTVTVRNKSIVQITSKLMIDLLY